MFHRPSKPLYEITTTDKKIPTDQAEFAVVFEKTSFIFEEAMEQKAATTLGFQFDKSLSKIIFNKAGTQGGEAEKALYDALKQAYDVRMIFTKEQEAIVQQFRSFMEKNGFEVEYQARASLGYYRPDGNAF